MYIYVLLCGSAYIQDIIQDIWNTVQSEGDIFHDTLSTLYKGVLDKWSIEYSWCSTVMYPGCLSMIVTVFSEGMNALPLSQYLHTNIHRSDIPVQSLIGARNVINTVYV